MENYKSILASRPWLQEVEYQVNFWSNPIHQSPNKPLVLGAGTSSGKTTIALVHIEMFYSDDTNKSAKTLLVPSATMVLRDNFEEALEAFGPKNFNYCICKTSQEVEDALNDPNCQVVVALPQSIIRLKKLPKLEWFILDEAQEWYGKNTMKSIIRKSKPTYQLLLTGTPFKFHRDRDKYLFYHVSVEELYDLKRVGNPRVEIVSTSYDVRFQDYNRDGNIKRSFTGKKHKEALWEVAEHMVKHLGLPESVKKQFLANRMTNKILSVFGELDPTIIYCSRMKQANEFYKIFNQMFPNQVLLSHSENDEDSEEFALFQEGNHKVLISVNRGRIGFDMPELFNIVDFTMTTNVDMLLQLLGRLLRLSKKKKTQKVYYKVASNNDAGYIELLMTGVLSLWMKDFYSYYSGDAREIRIPRISPTKPRGKKDKQPTTRPAVNRRALSNFLEMGVLSLDFWKKVLHYNNDKFATVSWTNLENVKREYYDYYFRDLNYDTCKEAALKFTNRGEFSTRDCSAYGAIMKNGWLELMTHMPDPTWTKEKVFKLIDEGEWKNYSHFITTYNCGYAIKRLGILDEVKAKFKGGYGKKYSFEECSTEAKKHTTKKSFYKTNRKMYDQAYNKGWLEDICEHMPNLRGKHLQDPNFKLVRKGRPKGVKKQ